MRLLILSAIWIGLVLVSPARAQNDFSAVRLKRGDVVFVTRAGGSELSGRVTNVTPAVITIDGVEVKPEPGLKIQRRGDPIWNGAANGAVIGLVLSVLVAGECETEWSFGACVASGTAWFAGVGALVDLLRVGRTTVYVGSVAPGPAAPRAGVDGGRGHRGVAFTLRF
jgi:hypothetical protein